MLCMAFDYPSILIQKRPPRKKCCTPPNYQHAESILLRALPSCVWQEEIHSTGRTGFTPEKTCNAQARQEEMR